MSKNAFGSTVRTMTVKVIDQLSLLIARKLTTTREIKCVSRENACLEKTAKMRDPMIIVAGILTLRIAFYDLPARSDFKSLVEVQS